MLNLNVFIKDSKLFRQYDADGLVLARYKCPLRKAEFSHWTENDFFVYVLSGRKKWRTIYGDHLVEKGDLVFVKKGVYTTHQYLDADFRAVIIFINDRFIKTNLKNLPQETSSETSVQKQNLLVLKTNKLITNYFDTLGSLFDTESYLTNELIRIKIKEFIHIVFASGENLQLHQYFKSLSLNSIDSLKEIMESNYTANLNLSAYAQLTGRSLSKFKRDFKRAYKQTPGRWLVDKKLELSKYRLETENTTIGQLAIDCGFEDTSHFIKIFKRRFGKTPLQHRKTLISFK